ncbi:MAG: DNA-binding protein [Mediterranea sp.]|jgi:predicted histone-like DNA-binding protein|nr:DNA-binding protein [Mediterranea sp.]
MAFYDLYETPDIQGTGEKQPLHARIVPSRTFTKEEFIEWTSRFQHFPKNMIGGIMSAVVDQLAYLLACGYNVEFGDLGHFSLSLKCDKKVTDKRKIRAESVRLGNVNLRVSKEFKQNVIRDMDLERVEVSTAHQQAAMPIEKRLQSLKDFLAQNQAISRMEYQRLTGLSHKKAVNDLNAFIAQGILRKRGAGRTVFYVLNKELS